MGEADRYGFLGQLEVLTGRRYVAAALVLTRPAWGLGGLAVVPLMLEISLPSVSSLDRLGAHMLCLTEAGTVEDWVLISSPAHGTAPSSLDHLVGEASPDELALGRVGVLTVRARWGAMRGRVPRRLRGDFERIASSTAVTSH